MAWIDLLAISHLKTGLVVAMVVLVAVTLMFRDIAFVAEIKAGLTREAIELWVARFGLLGPILVIALMTIVVVASPIPSAPIALTAGALYGHVCPLVSVR